MIGESLIFILAFYWIYALLYDEVTGQSFSVQVSKNWFFWFFGVVLLSGVNYSVECIKWRQLNEKRRSFGHDLAAVYAGTFSGLFTPDRLGNFLGRAAYFSKESRAVVISSTLWGNLLQLLVTVLASFFAFQLLLLDGHGLELPEQSILICGLFISLLVSLVIFFILIRRNLISNKNGWFWRKIQQYANPSFPNSVIRRAFFIGVLRYCIFVIQFWMVFELLQVNISIIVVFLFCGILYGVITFIPTPILGNLGTRELFSILLLSDYCDGVTAGIVALAIWGVNVLLPAIIGGGLLFSKRIAN